MKIITVILALGFVGMGCGDGGNNDGDGGDGGGVMPDPISLDMPTGFALSVVDEPFAVEASWDAGGEGVAGFLVARGTNLEDAETAQPGTAYSVGDSLGLFEVVYVGNGTSFSDTEVPVDDEVYYVIYAYDADSNYGPAASDSVEVPFPEQSGSISITGLNGTPAVTVGTQTSRLQIGGVATYNADTDELTLELDVTNLNNRVAFAVKASVVTVNQGTAVTDGIYQDNPTAFYGPEAIAVGGTTTRTIVFSGIDTSVDPIDVDLELYSHQMMTSGGGNSEPEFYLTDISGGRFLNGDAFGGTFDNQISNDNDDSSGAAGSGSSGAFSPDGSKLFFGLRNLPGLGVVDMTDFSMSASLNLSRNGETAGNANGVMVSPDGNYAYVTILDGAHRYDGNGAGSTGVYHVDFVKVRTSDLSEVGRVQLATGNVGFTRVHESDITTDGTVGVALVEREDGGEEGGEEGAGYAFVIDLVDMTVTHTVDLTEIDIAPRSVGINPDDSSAAIRYKEDTNDGTISLVELATGVATHVTPTDPDGVVENKYGTGMIWGPDGKLYIPGSDENRGEAALSIFNPADQSWEHLFTEGEGICNLQFSRDGGVIYLLDQSKAVGEPLGGGDRGGFYAVSAVDYSPVQIDGNDLLPAFVTYSSHIQKITP